VVACVLLTQPDGTMQCTVSTFGAMTSQLLALSDWLDTLQVTDVAMASTGVYRHPVFNVLEQEGPTLLVVNPQHTRAVPGE